MSTCQAIGRRRGAGRVGTKRVTLADVARRRGRLADGGLVRARPAGARRCGSRPRSRRASCRPRARRATGRTSSRGASAPARRHTIGFVSDTVATTPFAGHLIWGALEAARERGHLLFIGETEGDPSSSSELIEAMHDRGVDGIVLASMYTRKVSVPKALRRAGRAPERLPGHRRR